jgi:pyruvate-formate lyase-activating enzyme
LRITVRPQLFIPVYEALLAQGVPELRFLLEPSRHCPFIGHFIVFEGSGFMTCCHDPNGVEQPYAGSFEETIERYYTYCEKLRHDLNAGKPNSCTGCYKLSDGRAEDDLKIKRVSLTSSLVGGYSCNFKCCYCGYVGEKSKSEDSGSLYELIRQIGNLLDISYLGFNVGEIGVLPYKHEILQFWKNKKWKGDISTNGSIYLEGISDLLRDELIQIIVSLDAGTAKTFAKIKGVDFFEKVVKNIEKYAETGGDISLKYIILDGINCNNADVDGFVSIASKINTNQVIISRDVKVRMIKMSEEEYMTVSRLAQQCADRNIRYDIALSYLYMDTDRLKKDGLL